MVMLKRCVWNKIFFIVGNKLCTIFITFYTNFFINCAYLSAILAGCKITFHKYDTETSTKYLA